MLHRRTGAVRRPFGGIHWYLRRKTKIGFGALAWPQWYQTTANLTRESEMFLKTPTRTKNQNLASGELFEAPTALGVFLETKNPGAAVDPRCPSEVVRSYLVDPAISHMLVS